MPTDRGDGASGGPAAWRNRVVLAGGIAIGALWGVGMQLLVRQGGLALEIGNLPSLWLLLGAVAGALATGWVSGTIAGLLTSCAAVGSFYVTKHWIDDLSGIADFEAFWFLVAELVGSIAGALGQAFRQRRDAAAGLAPLLVIEQIYVFGRLPGSFTAIRLTVAGLELAVGVVIALAALVRSGALRLERIG